ncbi:hypothetical protein IV203_000060 [Nitzschia inconspicua]|uniref:Uncharacterized protein n=1 Tax=Nitzschia inconspicua TaxID=303405 RepID=A0A9K3L4T5_9STRA|nr:hypothetical protein IV203_000060 [Nitzschia inconspicua]
MITSNSSFLPVPPSHHRINYDRLKQIGWDATLRSGPEWIHETARTLQREKVFAALGCNEHRPETHLVVLDSDEVLSNERWQTLHHASDKVHMTGPDTRGRTVVFSSIALLANSVWCENMSWEVCGSVDGTHGISDSSYKLITLGVNAFCEEKMRRSFHPLVYIWGEGEREIVALHGFLNWKIAVRHLFGINTVCFKRGVVSDCTSAFSNSVRAALAIARGMDPMLQRSRMLVLSGYKLRPRKLSDGVHFVKLSNRCTKCGS